MRRVYLDHSATTPLDPRVFEAMRQAFLEVFGNASSVHAFGREARALLEQSRESVAAFLGARSDEIFFTSGGTESNNAAISGIAEVAAAAGRNHLLVSAVEHHAVLHPAESLRKKGFAVQIIPVDDTGLVDPDEIRKAITPKTCLVSIMHANNEVGTIEPIKEIAAFAREHGVVVHTDAVQSVGKIPVNVDELGVDLLSLSAHKFYGPKGIGVLYIRRGTTIESLIKGGGQESNRRAGTQNVPLAVGVAKALEICAERMTDDAIRCSRLKHRLRERLQFDGILFNGHPTRSLPNVLSVSFDSTVREVDGDALIAGMDLRGVAVTSGSACSSGSLEPSHVLLAMGRHEKTASATIRFSLGRSTTEEDIDYAVEALEDVLKTMQQVGVS
jgi:cysteine desulfurase